MNATSPTGLHGDAWVGEQTGLTWCWVCGADPGNACTCAPDFHLGRYIRARDEHRISSADVIHAIPPEAFSGEQRLTGGTVLPSPGAAA